MMKQAILILGATAGIGKPLAAELAEEGHDLLLTGRDANQVALLAQELRERYGVAVETLTFDAEQVDTHPTFVDAAIQLAGELEGVFVVFGYLGHHPRAVASFDEAQKIIQCNFTGACSVLIPLANYFESRRQGFIVGISSVAGDRGRRTNYTYGAAKSGFTTYLSGLRSRLHKAHVHVMTVKPGYVDTPMIRGRPGTFWVAQPDKVARSILRALKRKKNVVYVPWFWRPLLLAAKLLPEWLFKRLPI